MNANNAAVLAGLEKAQKCIRFLGELDPILCVTGISFDNASPVVSVDHAPRNPMVLSALKSRVVNDGEARCTRVATLRGCVVQWEEIRGARGARS